jgi:hypothetical protein
MIPTCDSCAGWIDTSNRRWPGYCSPGCREADRLPPSRRAPAPDPYATVARDLVRRGLADISVTW